MSYLNYNSTNAPMNQTLNISDIGYDQVMLSRRSINMFIVAVKRFINAPPNAKVIINSGATESIANMVHWGKLLSPYGAVYGTDLDHDAVKDNCENFDVPYKQLKKKLPTDASIIILTHASGKTGEYMDVENFSRNFTSHTFLNEHDASTDSNVVTEDKRLRQYRPIVALDASQSITKLKIDMDKWKLDAVFWSMHKIGGPPGLGVLVVNETPRRKFKPLIAGSQQMNLRGGTLPLAQIINCEQYLKHNQITTMKAWKDAVEYLKDEGLDIIMPVRKHLFNTILIRLNQCPLGIINALAKNRIYVGSVSSCALEKYADEAAKTEKEGFLRLSFADPEDVKRDILKEVVSTVRKYEKMQGGDVKSGSIELVDDEITAETNTEDDRELLEMLNNADVEDSLDIKLAFA